MKEAEAAEPPAWGPAGITALKGTAAEATGTKGESTRAMGAAEEVAGALE